jgi:diaminohydroxyphosphoribosylaminopyrimidine deaminase/5-amino-6-(5-phosphoribosylamino)uracil reductase
VKTASSLDGKLATKTGDSKWISSSSSRTFVHYLRSVSDAVLVGVNTVIADDPRLTVRESFEDNDPYKIVIDPDGKIPVRCGLVKNSAERLIWVTGTFGKHDCADILRDKGATVIELNSQNGYLDLHQLAGKLYGLNIMNVLIEGGGETAGGFFDAGLVDKGYFFLAPKIIGGRMAVSAVGGEGVSFVKDAPVMLETDVRRFEDDFLISGRFKDYRTHVLELTEKLRNRCSLGL